MFSPEEMAECFIRRMESAQTLEELDIVARDIKEWRDFLLTYYQSNMNRILKPGDPESITKKR